MASVVDETVQFMHQTAREFIIQTIPDASQLQFEITDMAHKTVAATWVRYLILCFTSPCMQEGFSKITSWAESDFRAYAEYLNEWPLIEYTLRFMKEHLHLCGSNEEVTQLVTTLIRLLTDNQASYFLGRSLGCHLGLSNEKDIPVNEQQEASENIIYSTLNAAAEPKLPHVVEALLLTCAQNCPDVEQKTPLIRSAQKGLIGATQLFLNKNIEKDAKDNLGRTALHYAAENGSEAIVQLLMEQRANDQIKDNQKKTALHIAVEKS